MIAGNYSKGPNRDPPIKETPNHDQFRQGSWFPLRVSYKIQLKANQKSISRPSGPGDCLLAHFQLDFIAN